MTGHLTTQIRSSSWRGALAVCVGLTGCTAAVSGPTGGSNANAGSSANPTGSGGAGSHPVGGGGVGVGGGGSLPDAQCTNMTAVQRRLWRLSVEQYQTSVKDLLGLSTVPQLTNRGGEAQWAFFSDVSLGVDDSFQYALYQVVESVLPQIPAALTSCNAGEAATACATRVATDF